jgi:hypothetical protein
MLQGLRETSEHRLKPMLRGLRETSEHRLKPMLRGLRETSEHRLKPMLRGLRETSEHRLKPMLREGRETMERGCDIGTWDAGRLRRCVSRFEDGLGGAYLGFYCAVGETTVMDLSIRTQRAGRFSCGATRRKGPCLGIRGAPSMVSATITSESRIPESSSARENTTR